MSAPPLPHAFPFVLLDRVTAGGPLGTATGRRQVTSNDPLLGPDGLLAAVFLLEGIAQCAGAAVAGADPGRGGMLASVSRFRTAGRVVAGDSLEVTAKIVRRFGRLVKARGRVRANGRLRASAEVVLQIAEPSGITGWEAG